MEVFTVPLVAGARSSDDYWDNPTALARVRDVQYSVSPRFYPQRAGPNTGNRASAGKTAPNMYRKAWINLEEQRRPYADDVLYFQMTPVAGTAVPCSFLFNVAFGTAAGARVRDVKKVYRRAAILDFRNVGANAFWVKYWSGYPYGGDESPLPIGISFWHNDGFDPQFFRIDYQWPTIPARSGTVGGTQLPAIPGANMMSQSGGERIRFFSAMQDAISAINDRAVAKFGGRQFQMYQPGGALSASRTGWRMTNSENKNMVYWWQRLSRPGGSVFRIDFEACKEYNLCLVTVRVFAHRANWSDET